MREYLELEFLPLKALVTEKNLDFDYNVERLIDDFILMGIFVGNDFLPNLPDLHINQGAFALMFDIYRETLPIAGEYRNRSK